MSMTPLSDDDDLLAAELALGLLSGGDAAMAQARAASDGAFRDRVAWWEDRLTQFGDVADMAAPSAAVWQRINARLSAHQADTTPGATPRAANDNLLARIARQPAMAMLAVALAIAGFGAWSWRPGVAPPVVAPVVAPVRVLVAELSGAGSVHAAIAYQPADARLQIVPGNMPADPRSPELWIIPADGTPRSLGVINGAAPGSTVIAPDRRGFLAGGASFAISMEPAGGSPTGLPTGPVVASGKIYAG